MKYTIKSTDNGCVLSAVEFHTTTDFPLPVKAADLTAAWAALLRDPILEYVELPPIIVVRSTTGISIETNAGKFAIPYRHLFAIEGAL